MNKVLLSSIGLFFITQVCAAEEPSLENSANSNLLPSPYPVYVVKDAGVVNHPYPGALKILLPTDNSYADSPGCYIACYSHQPGLYAVSPDISVMGQIRVPGTYLIRICHPVGYKNMDISKAEQLKELCALKFKTCSNNSCWAGGILAAGLVFSSQIATLNSVYY